MRLFIILSLLGVSMNVWAKDKMDFTSYCTKFFNSNVFMNKPSPQDVIPIKMEDDGKLKIDPTQVHYQKEEGRILTVVLKRDLNVEHIITRDASGDVVSIKSNPIIINHQDPNDYDHYTTTLYTFAYRDGLCFPFSGHTASGKSDYYELFFHPDVCRDLIKWMKVKDNVKKIEQCNDAEHEMSDIFSKYKKDFDFDGRHKFLSGWSGQDHNWRQSLLVTCTGKYASYQDPSDRSGFNWFASLPHHKVMQQMAQDESFWKRVGPLNIEKEIPKAQVIEQPAPAKN